MALWPMRRRNTSPAETLNDLIDGLASGNALNESAIAKHGDAIGELGDFSDMVGNEHDRSAVGPKLAHNPVQVFALGQTKHGRGFIEHENSRVSRQGLADFNELLLTRRELANWPLDLNPAQPHRFQNALAFRSFSRTSEDAKRVACRVSAQKQVVLNAQIRRQGKLLEHHCQAGCSRFLRAEKRNFLAAIPEAAGIWPDEAPTDSAQRGLARPVFPDDAMDLTGENINGDPPERPCRSEGLANVN
ncbi:hypothetical protein RB548_23290 (plasmid) [Sinorhizobium chiapasense]|uniref:Uncharacterized protein n=1 Tax=Sinorhizobium chiapasense TaxID=501572 RepID=A0ABZ2BIA9_9HYPH